MHKIAVAARKTGVGFTFTRIVIYQKTNGTISLYILVRAPTRTKFVGVTWHFIQVRSHKRLWKTRKSNQLHESLFGGTFSTHNGPRFAPPKSVGVGTRTDRF